MGHVVLGMFIGLSSAITCAIAGQISFLEFFLIYWIMGTVAPLLHIALFFREDLAKA